MVDKDNKEKGSKVGFFGFLGALGIGALLGYGVSKLLDNEDKKVDEKNKEKEKVSKNIEKQRSIGSDNVNKTNSSSITTNDNNTNQSTVEHIESMFCPISQELMIDPVITPDGISYDRKSIESWLSKSNTCPLTKNKLTKEDLRPNRNLKDVIQVYIKNNTYRNNA